MIISLYKSPNFSEYPGMDLANEYYNRGHVFFKLGELENYESQLQNSLSDFCTGLKIYKRIPNIYESNDMMKSFNINIQIIHNKLYQIHDEYNYENICSALNEESSTLGANTNTEELI